MELESLKQFQDLGVGITAVLGVCYILYFFIKTHKEELDNSRKEREASHSTYMSYIETNNHQKTELISKHTEAMVETRNAIGDFRESVAANTETIRELTKLIISSRK
jgi:predicted transcriptional regulator